MSSVANCHNHSTSAAMSESDNDEENAFDSSYNRQNESMMHKVKDVVSKFLHPSFLFSTNDDTSRPKRKRSTSIEEHNDEQQTTTNTTNTTNGHSTRPKSKYDRSIIKDDEPQITDDEDNNSRDVPSNEQDLTETEQQKKRRRTANYQHILSTKTTNSHHNDDIDERTSSPLMSTDSVKSLSNLRINQTSTTTPVRVQTLIEQSHSERLNRLTASKQRFNILPTYRGSTSNYDPSKSPLFSSGNRKQTTEATTTATNLKSNEFSANHLLASSLISRPQSSSLSNRQQSPATLSNPIANNNSNRLLSNERQMFGVNYASINSRRLPYIERLRRRTLEDCVRLNQTADNEPLSRSIIEEHKSTPTASPAPKRTRAPEKECGIQCDILTVENSMESNKKNQRTFPPADIQNEAISGPSTKKNQLFSEIDSSIQTDSSITIEKIQSSIPTFNITKPKVLGNVTPFSWPKFARAQEEYAKKYPEKCRSDAVVPSTIPKSNVNINSTNTSSNANTISKLPIFPFTPSRPVEAIWKCPSCTKEHPAQTASCSLCHGMNPNYKKLSAIESTKTIEKQPVLSNKLPDVIAKEPSIPTPSVTNTNQTTPIITKENVSSIPSVITTSAPSTTFASFAATSTLSSPITTKENPVVTSTAPLFGTTTSDKTPTTSANISIQTSTAFPPFIPPSTASTTPAFPPFVPPSTTSTTAAFPAFVPPSSTATTTAAFPPFVPPSSTSTTAAFPPFVPPSSTTTTTAAFPPFVPPSSTTTTTAAFPPFIPPSTTSTTAAFPPFVPPSSTTTTTAAFPPFVPPSTTSTATAAFPPFVPPSSTSATTAVTSSTVPSITTVAPTTATSTPFGAFSATPIVPTTTATSVVSTTPSSQSPASTFASNTTAPVVATVTSTFPVLPTASAFTSPSTFGFGSTAAASVPPAFGSTVTTSASPAFGSGGLNFPSASTTTTSTTSSNAPFTFSPISPTRSFASTLGSPMNTTSVPAFGTIAPFGTSSSFSTNTAFGAPAPFGTSSAFGTTSTQGDRPPSSIAPFSSSSTSNTPLSFGFGATSNTTQASTVSTGGFSFTPPTSTAPAPVFGASPPPLSNPFGFGTTPTASPISNLFQFSAPTSTPMINPSFSTPIASQSTIDSTNPFSIGSGESSTDGGRPILKAKRRRP